MKQSTMQIPLRALTSALSIHARNGRWMHRCTSVFGSRVFDDVNQAVTPGQTLAGRPLFVFALSLTNGRACATCHPKRSHRAAPLDSGGGLAQTK